MLFFLVVSRPVIFFIIKKDQQCKAERVIYTLSVRRPQPTISTYRQKKEKGKNSRTIVGIEQQQQLRTIKKHWP